MKFWDYHTHHERCNHAEGKLEEYVSSAISNGLSEIGLSDHFPMYLLPEEAKVWQYSMEKDEFPQYIEDCIALREKYKDKIIVKIASEVDFFSPVFQNYHSAVSPYLDNFDYIIGSIHVAQWEGTPAFGVDEEVGMRKCKEFGANKVYMEYYNGLKEMVKTKFYNIVGHLDLPKKFGIRPENDEIVNETLFDLLDSIAESNMSMEINTAGFLKPVNEQYPAEYIIKAAIDRGIDINFGSDSHKPKNIGYRFIDILPIVKKMGLTHLVKWSKFEKSKVKL
jgi:histidinol-phosphatase (PHP family)